MGDAPYLLDRYICTDTTPHPGFSSSTRVDAEGRQIDDRVRLQSFRGPAIVGNEQRRARPTTGDRPAGHGREQQLVTGHPKTGAPYGGNDKPRHLLDLDRWERRAAIDRGGGQPGAGYSPNGDRITFTSFRDWNYEINRMGPDGSEETRLKFDRRSDWQERKGR